MKRIINTDFNRYQYILFVLPLFLLDYSPDNDLWFLFSCGREVLKNGFPFIEPLSFHENFSYVMQQWLFAVGAYTGFSHFGMLHIYIFMAFFFILVELVLYRTCMLLCNNRKVSSLSTFTAAMILSLNMSTRPIGVTILILCLLLWCMESFTATQKPKYLLWLPLLSILSVNTQAAMWLIPFIFIMPYICEVLFALIIKKEPCMKHLLYMMAAAVLYLVCGFFNPYGIHAMTYVLGSYGVKTINVTINEMLAPSVSNLYARCTVFFVLATILLMLRKKSGPVALRHVLLCLGTMYLAFSSYRSLSLLLICLPLFIAHTYKDIPSKATKKPAGNLHFTAGVLALFLSIGVLCCIYIESLESPYPKEYDLLHTFAEEKTPEELSNVRLLIGFDQGGCAAYCGIPVYIDPRAEVYLKVNNKKEDIFDEYYQLLTGRVSLDTILTQHRITHIYGDFEDLFVVYAEHHPDFKLIAEDEHGKLFERIH